MFSGVRKNIVRGSKNNVYSLKFTTRMGHRHIHRKVHFIEINSILLYTWSFLSLDKAQSIRKLVFIEITVGAFLL